jgi:hypothetical protein
VLVGVELDREPELIVWGNRLRAARAETVLELKRALDDIEGAAGQQTEADVILRAPGWGWIFVEAKLASPTSTYRGRPAKLPKWRERYATSAPFNADALRAADPALFPEQLLRNVAVAVRVAAGENVAVVALVRQAYVERVADLASGYLVDEEIRTCTATWEQLHALADREASLHKLAVYLSDKSVNLRPALQLGHG